MKLFGIKVMMNLDSIFKSRDIALPTKFCLVKAMVFSVFVYGSEIWTIKKAEHWRINAFELWCWRRLLRVCWTARRPNQSILKEISPEYSLEGLMLKLKLQHFGHLMRRTDSSEKILTLGKTEGRKKGDNRGWYGWMAPLTHWTWVLVNSGSWWWTGKPGVLQSMGSQRVGHNWAETERSLNFIPGIWANMAKWKLLSCVWLFATPWTTRNSPGQNTRVGNLSLLQGIFPTQGLNPGIPHCRQILYQVSHKGNQEYWNG